MNSCDFPPFRAHRLARSGHLQTIIATYHRPSGFPYRAQRHTVKLAEGESLILHDDRPPGWHDGDRVLLLVHGLAGCHGSPYLVRTAGKLNQRGLRTFRMDLRGMGAGATLAKGLAHAGRSGDVRAALSYLATVAQHSPISVIGFSMGGNLVLKMLGEDGAQTLPRLDSALAVAPPIDLARCCRELESGIGRIYSRVFTRMLLRLVKEKAHVVQRVPEVMAHPPRGLWEFDDRITAPLSGFGNATEYYAQSSACRYLSEVRVPTLIVSARDDPIIPSDIFRSVDFSPSTSLYLAGGGGHVGFYGAAGGDPDRWWLDWRIVEWTGRL